MVASMPLIANCNAVVQFGNYLKCAFEYFEQKILMAKKDIKNQLLKILDISLK